MRFCCNGPHEPDTSDDEVDFIEGPVPADWSFTDQLSRAEDFINPLPSKSPGGEGKTKAVTKNPAAPKRTRKVSQKQAKGKPAVVAQRDPNEVGKTAKKDKRMPLTENRAVPKRTRKVSQKQVKGKSAMDQENMSPEASVAQREMNEVGRTAVESSMIQFR
ncbi:hypothetical protein E4U40_004121 [Claviceps sp. LM458 group G5]|nr:hypothetical protein E4U40_004121 [Claviceps sp. LM458 group G5]